MSGTSHDADAYRAKVDDTVVMSDGDKKRLERILSRYYRPWFSHRPNLSYSRHPSPNLARYLQSRRKTLWRDAGWLEPPLITKLRDLGGHSGTTLLLKNAIDYPWQLLDKKARDELRATPEESYFAHDAAHRMVFVMGAAGYRPLIERHDIKNDFVFVHAQGPEETQKQTGHRDTRYKLPSEPATVYPNRMIGPSLGNRLGERLDMVCPDIVAYILIERNLYLSDLGPKFFKLEDIEKEIGNRPDGAKILERLRARQFEIRPDFLRDQSEDLGIGGVTDINLLGPHKGGAPKYMRFDVSRIKHDPDEEDAGVAELAFKSALQDIAKKQRIPLHMQRGDVLLVNNRRVATQWTTARRQYSAGYGVHQLDNPLVAGDRVVLRMCFYQPSSSAGAAQGRESRPLG